MAATSRRAPPALATLGTGDVSIEQVLAVATHLEAAEAGGGAARLDGRDYRDIEALALWAGQGVALARQPQSAADIVAELTSRL
jgi:hypothetical protein